MGPNPEIGGRGQPFQNRAEGARSRIRDFKASAETALKNMLSSPDSRLATNIVGFGGGKIDVTSDSKQRGIQRTQLEDRPKSRVQTQTIPVKTDFTPEQLEELEEARRRRLREEQEIAGGPTQKDIAGANAGELRPNRLVKFIQENKALTAAIGVGTAAVGVGVVAAGANALFNNNRTEANQQNIDNRTEASQSIKNSEESFKATKLKDVITDDNVIEVSLRDLQNLPQFDRDGRPVILITAPPQGETSSVERKANFADIGNERIGNFDTEGLFNIIEVELHANEPIPMPIDGYVFPTWLDREGGKRLASVEVLFELSNGRIGKISIYTPDIRDELSEAIRNTQIPAATRETFKNNNWKQGLKLERGVPVSTMPVETNYPVEYQLQEIDPVTGEHFPSSISALAKDGKFPRIK